jgi:hypothetical protein
MPPEAFAGLRVLAHLSRADAVAVCQAEGVNINAVNIAAAQFPGIARWAAQPAEATVTLSGVMVAFRAFGDCPAGWSAAGVDAALFGLVVKAARQAGFTG